MIQNRIYNYFERNQELRVLFIFDPMRNIITELEGVKWRDGYRLVEFQGNWFATKYALENEWREEKIILYLPMLAPSNQEARLKFPLMDVLAANAE